MIEDKTLKLVESTNQFKSDVSTLLVLSPRALAKLYNERVIEDGRVNSSSSALKDLPTLLRPDKNVMPNKAEEESNNNFFVIL